MNQKKKKENCLFISVCSQPTNTCLYSLVHYLYITAHQPTMQLHGTYEIFIVLFKRRFSLIFYFV